MWVSHHGSSAGEPPTPEQRERWRRRMGPPENEFAAAVGLSALLGRTDDAAVGLTDMRMQGPTTNIDSDQLVLVQQGGGGGERNVNQSYWVAPPEPAIAPPQPPPRPRPSSGWFADPPG